MGEKLQGNTNSSPQHPLAADTNSSISLNGSTITCHADAESEAVIILTLAALGVVANTSLMGLILLRNSTRRYPRPLKW